MQTAHEVTINGITYRSIEFAYTQLKPEISLSTFRKKIRNGILDIDELTQKHADFVIQGFHYTNTKTAYEDLQPPISLALFRSRISNGVTDDKLLLPAKNNNAKTIKYYGKTYKTVKEAFDDIKPDMALNSFYWRVRQGYQDDKLTAKTPLPSSKSITIDGKHYETIRQVYDDLKPDISLLTFYKRIRNGVRDKDALTAPSARKGVMRKEITINGVTYKTIRQAYNMLKPPISILTFYKRHQNGLTDNDLLVRKNKIRKDK